MPTDNAQIAVRVALAPPVAHLARDLELLLIVLDCPPRFAQGGIGHAQIAVRDAFAPAVADLARDREPLLMMLDRPAWLAQSRIGNAQIAERIRLGPPVADFARDRELLHMKLDSPARLAQVPIKNTQSAERGALAAAIPDLPTKAERALDVRHRFGNTPKLPLIDPQLEQESRALGHLPLRFRRPRSFELGQQVIEHAETTLPLLARQPEILLGPQRAHLAQDFDPWRLDRP